MVKSLQKFLATRVQIKEKSERDKMLELAANYKGVINLGRGDPDLATPENIINAGQEALKNGATHYSPLYGNSQLREAIANYLWVHNKVHYNPKSEILVTSGAQEAIATIILSLVNPGDEVLVPEPRYTPYDFSIKLAGGNLMPVPTYADDQWAVTIRELEKVVTRKSKVLLLINPNNPTGTLMGADELTAIADFAKKHDLVVISDELYSGLIFENTPWMSVSSLSDMRNRTIVINGFSKTFSMTGWRLGYIAGPEEFIEAMANVHYSLTISAPAVSQVAGIEALNGNQESTFKTIKLYEGRRDLVIKLLNESNMPFVKPMGGFYVFPQISQYGLKSFDFCVRLLEEANVLAFPGSAYGAYGEGYMRISLLRPNQELGEAITRIRDVLRNLR